MKHLKISEIALLSNLDRKARRIRFDPRRTILLGLNQTGKSSLVKSIYHALGAEPARMDQRWINAEVKSLIKFTVDDKRFTLTRDSNYFSVFDGDGNFIKSFTHVTDGLGPFLASIFDFKLVLAARDQSAQIPPPAFLYLPFYIDQDASWQAPWRGFARLMQYAAWTSTVAEYHTGARDNYFYELQASVIELQRALGQLVQQVDGLRSVMTKLSQDRVRTTFDLNPNAFSDQVTRLLQESENLLGQESKFKERLSELNSQRALQRSRLSIATRALGEIGKDFNFLSSLPTEHIECPTCGTEYENDFATRFAIATDEDRVAIFIEQIREELSRIEREIDSVYREFRLTEVQAGKIQGILAEQQGELTLRQVIESEGRKSADNLLSNQLIELDNARAAEAMKLGTSKDNLSAHEEKLQKTEDEVLAEYDRLLRKNLAGLNVLPLSADIYDSLSPYIRETGSSLPRALLAYYFTIFELASVRTPSTVCPFVIDSPNQQAQDDLSLETMLRFISTNQPADTQMILAVEKTMGIDLGGEVIELTEKYHLLNDKDYESVRSEFTALTKKSFG
jgi:hypothetical protein